MRNKPAPSADKPCSITITTIATHDIEDVVVEDDGDPDWVDIDDLTPLVHIETSRPRLMIFRPSQCLNVQVALQQRQKATFEFAWISRFTLLVVGRQWKKRHASKCMCLNGTYPSFQSLVNVIHGKTANVQLFPSSNNSNEFTEPSERAGIANKQTNKQTNKLIDQQLYPKEQHPFKMKSWLLVSIASS